MRRFTFSDLAAIVAIIVLVGVFIWGMAQYSPKSQTNAWNGGVKTIEHNGHEYLYFFSHGLTHNPDCKCMKKGE